MSSQTMSFLDMYIKYSPFQHYPIETLIVIIIFFSFSLWFMGTKINFEITQQLAIPLLKEITDMGFAQNPGFNTLSHPMRRGYIQFPSPLHKGVVTSIDTNDNASSTTTTTTTATTTPPIIKPLIGATPYPTLDQLDNYIWAESHHSYHLYATAHPTFNGIHCHITTQPRHDILLQLGALFGMIPNDDLVTIQIAFKDLPPFFWSLSRDRTIVKDLLKNKENLFVVNNDDVEDDTENISTDGNDNDGGHGDDTKNNNVETQSLLNKNDGTNPKPTNTKKIKNNSHLQKRIGNVIDLGGLKLTHSLYSPKSEYVYTTDTPELLSMYYHGDDNGNHNNKNGNDNNNKKEQGLSPCPDQIIQFLLNLASATSNSFIFESLSISDQSDGYDVVNLTDITTYLTKNGYRTNNTINHDTDIPHDEESSLLSLSFKFNFANVPRTNDDQDCNNQEFVNSWVTKICAQLFILAFIMVDYQLPPSIRHRNEKIRDEFIPGQQLTGQPTKKEEKTQKTAETQAREGISNSIIGVGNLRKRSTAIKR